MSDSTVSKLDQSKLDSLPVGTVRRLNRLADTLGRFSMLAIDQRGSLRRMLARQTNQTPETVAPQSLQQVKRIVSETVAPLATGILTDPTYGYPFSADVIPARVGVLLAAEVSGYVSPAAREEERLSQLIEGWSAGQTLEAGADAVKLLIYHHPKASADTLAHQRKIVETVGQACKSCGMPFILEAVTYPLNGMDKRSADFARMQPELIVQTARTYSDPCFNVHLLKLEFPGSLKYTQEYQEAGFGNGEVICDRSEVEEACRRLDQAAQVPWVILSAGVTINEFAENLRLATRAGASGFLCGRAVWKHVVDYFPDKQAMHQHMSTTGRANFQKLLSINKQARPWHEHPSFSGSDGSVDC